MIQKLEIYDLGGLVLEPLSEEETAADERKQGLGSKTSMLQVNTRNNSIEPKSSQL